MSHLFDESMDDGLVPIPAHCETIRADFSAYLDSTISGVAMATIQKHLEVCATCSQEFDLWRDIQRSLGDLGPAPAPPALHSQLRAAIAAESARGSYLPWGRQILRAWDTTIAPAALRLSGGLAAALLLAGGLGWLFAAPIAVQANDDKLANLTPPRYLYSEAPPQTIDLPADAPIVVEAMVDERGRAYDYQILQGPQDQHIRVQVAGNLLTSVFKPATVFGVPVRGHVVMTFTGVSVHG